jgi:hypothetical protein
MGMKADWTLTVSACANTPVAGDELVGCHWQLDHGIGKRGMERKHGVDLKDLAAKHHARWLLYSEGLAE